MTETMNKVECLNENEMMLIDGGRGGKWTAFWKDFFTECKKCIGEMFTF